MKGIIFTELLAMAEDNSGEEVADRIIEDSDLPSCVACTTVGNYPCNALFNLIGGFSAHSGTPPEDSLQRLFGHWKMQSFTRHNPQFFEGRAGGLDMIYRAPRPLADFCHVGETARISGRDGSENGQTVVTFRVETGSNE